MIIATDQRTEPSAAAENPTGGCVADAGKFVDLDRLGQPANWPLAKSFDLDILSRRSIGRSGNQRTVAIASSDDLSAALTGTQTDGITGYSIASAVDLIRNTLLWSCATHR